MSVSWPSSTVSGVVRSWSVFATNSRRVRSRRSRASTCVRTSAAASLNARAPDRRSHPSRAPRPAFATRLRSNGGQLRRARGSVRPPVRRRGGRPPPIRSRRGPTRRPDRASRVPSPRASWQREDHGARSLAPRHPERELQSLPAALSVEEFGVVGPGFERRAKARRECGCVRVRRRERSRIGVDLGALRGREEQAGREVSELGRRAAALRRRAFRRDRSRQDEGLGRLLALLASAVLHPEADDVAQRVDREAIPHLVHREDGARDERRGRHEHDQREPSAQLHGFTSRPPRRGGSRRPRRS